MGVDRRSHNLAEGVGYADLAVFGCIALHNHHLGSLAADTRLEEGEVRQLCQIQLLEVGLGLEHPAEI